MQRRLIKQMLYGAFYLACWGIFGFLVYMLFLKPAPSCFDHIQNQGEQGVDCGGPCATVCVPETTKPLARTGDVYMFPIDAKHVSLLASIANPNALEAAQNVSYTFTLYDADGTTTIDVVKGITYAYAGEVKYIAIPNEPVSKLPAKVDLTLGTPRWVPASGFAKPAFTIPNPNAFINGAGNIEVDGNIANQDVISFPSVEIVAIFYNSLGNAAGVSETVLNNLNPNESRAFTILHPDLQGVNLAATKVYAYAYRP